jgi:hypothetical protein
MTPYIPFFRRLRKSLIFLGTLVTRQLTLWIRNMKYEILKGEQSLDIPIPIVP